MSIDTAATLCLIEDDPIMGESLVDRLQLEGLSCDWHRNGEAALAALERVDYAAIVSDIALPDIDGETLYQTVLARDGMAPPTLFITGYGSVDQAVRLLQLGAQDYITKPFDLDVLLERLQSVCPVLFANGDWQRSEAMLGVSPAMRHVQDVLARAAAHGARVLLTGESGVGKEYAARYFHDCTDPDGVRPFQALNCAAVQESLLEAELFGHEKGAFTGAVRARRGVFERSHGGTLLLDEVGDMSLGMQSKLLRVLQDGRFERVGGARVVDVDAALICATNRDLEQMVEEGAFREDLFYRINVLRIAIAPLRERREDILWFARMFLARQKVQNGITRVLSPGAARHLQRQHWPGNVRELQHTIERACVLSADTVIEASDLSSPSSPCAPAAVPVGAATPVALKGYLEDCERDHIAQILEEHGWRVAETAAALGISRKNLWEKMRRHGIERPA
jgi:DNA-binding NtrC family response regulator